MSDFLKIRTCTSRLTYHIVWTVKYRRKVLDGIIKKRLEQILQDIAKDKGFVIEKLMIEDFSYVECVVSSPPKLAPTNIAGWLKGISGRLLLYEHPELREQLWHGQLWNDSFFVESLGAEDAHEFCAYLERQERCQQ